MRRSRTPTARCCAAATTARSTSGTSSMYGVSRTALCCNLTHVLTQYSHARSLTRSLTGRCDGDLARAFASRAGHGVPPDERDAAHVVSRQHGDRVGRERASSGCVFMRQPELLMRMYITAPEWRHQPHGDRCCNQHDNSARSRECCCSSLIDLLLDHGAAATAVVVDALVQGATMLQRRDGHMTLRGRKRLGGVLANSSPPLLACVAW